MTARIARVEWEAAAISSQEALLTAGTAECCGKRKQKRPPYRGGLTAVTSAIGWRHDARDTFTSVVGLSSPKVAIP